MGDFQSNKCGQKLRVILGTADIVKTWHQRKVPEKNGVGKMPKIHLNFVVLTIVKNSHKERK